ncbi:uncharacterized protein BKA55DRAFT_691672 [Fusarium redolens]|uniref:Ankyrin repeat protein n=1 Tax=Fusarium redolens TaxID=48865 RepID=A0A9P9K809_FUSRE|nr:uncharacterized protein BKA55DRAFT_691672 [Fusarium redolens]KAH7247571.1 hypothetical protein BKA55DRAFT_691672 [Fusarium redolens]
MVDAASSSNFDVQSTLDGVGSQLCSLSHWVTKKGLVTLPGNVHAFDAFQVADGKLRYTPLTSTKLELSLLAYAASQGKYEEVMVLLLASEANKQPGEAYDDTFYAALDEALDEALFLALFYGHRKVAKLLLRRGAKPGAQISHSGIHGAASRGLRKEIRNYIIRHRVDPDVFDGSGGTPVICAMHLDNPHDWNTIKLLFPLGANTQARVGVATIALFWSYPDFARAMGKEKLAKQMEKAIALDKSHREIPDYHLID